MNTNDLITLAESLRGQELQTLAKGATFRVEARRDGLQIIPSTEKPRFVSREELDRVCERYESGGSLATTPYADITHNASYLLALIDRQRQAT